MLNSRVASVSRNVVTVVDSKKNETSDIPFGACVWATGVAMHPLVKQLQVRMTSPSPKNFSTFAHQRIDASTQGCTDHRASLIHRSCCDKPSCRRFIPQSQGSYDANQWKTLH